MPTSVRDVAQRAGVSVGTVSNVLNHPEKVLPDTVSRVHAAIDALGFVRNDAARQLRDGRSSTVGFILFQSGNPFFAEVARAADAVASEHGLALLQGTTEREPAREDAYLDLFQRQRVRGVLLAPAASTPSRVAELRRLGVPVVLVDRDGTEGHVSSVSVDDVAGAELAVGHLLERGRRRIAYVAARSELRQVADRLEGARRAVARVADASLEVVDAGDLDTLAGRAAGESILARRAAERPDGVFAVNDLVAVGFLQAVVLSGSVRVPDDIALVGYDDIDFAAAAMVPITSVRQPARDLGRRAMELVISEADDPELAPSQVVFQPELVVRESTG